MSSVRSMCNSFRQKKSFAEPLSVFKIANVVKNWQRLNGPLGHICLYFLTSNLYLWGNISYPISLWGNISYPISYLFS